MTTMLDRAKSALLKLADLTDAQIRRKFGTNAHLGGSTALGINLPDSSDVDIFVPYKKRQAYDAAVKRIGEKYPELKLNRASRNKTDKATFSGMYDGKDTDVVLAFGPKAQRFEEAFQGAKGKLDDEYRRKIVAEKKRLKNAWFFPEWRYKRYKNQVAKELGLKDAYF